MIEDEEIDFKSMRKLDYKTFVLIIIVIVAFVGFYIGHQIGYREGYMYVDNWYGQYINLSCHCSEQVKNYSFYTPDSLNYVNMTIGP